MRERVPNVIGCKREDTQAVEWEKQEQKIQGIESRRLHLSGEAVTRIAVLIPNGQRAVANASDPEMKPRVRLADRLPIREQRKLTGQ